MSGTAITTDAPGSVLPVTYVVRGPRVTFFPFNSPCLTVPKQHGLSVGAMNINVKQPYSSTCQYDYAACKTLWTSSVKRLEGCLNFTKVMVTKGICRNNLSVCLCWVTAITFVRQAITVTTRASFVRGAFTESAAVLSV